MSDDLVDIYHRVPDVTTTYSMIESYSITLVVALLPSTEEVTIYLATSRDYRNEKISAPLTSLVGVHSSEGHTIGTSGIIVSSVLVSKEVIHKVIDLSSSTVIASFLSVAMWGIRDSRGAWGIRVVQVSSNCQILRCKLLLTTGRIRRSKLY